ncbi:MAG: hypothetical protein K8F52_13545 [Candidatus Scalindua rubra]|nr:hypothetical protein [Candidatus Scalindua rubra]
MKKSLYHYPELGASVISLSPALLRFDQPAINRNPSTNSTMSQECYRKYEKGVMPCQWQILKLS